MGLTVVIAVGCSYRLHQPVKLTQEILESLNTSVDKYLSDLNFLWNNESYDVFQLSSAAGALALLRKSSWRTRKTR